MWYLNINSELVVFNIKNVLDEVFFVCVYVKWIKCVIFFCCFYFFWYWDLGLFLVLYVVFCQEYGWGYFCVDFYYLVMVVW